MTVKLKRLLTPVVGIFILFLTVVGVPQIASAVVTCTDGTTAATADACKCNVGNESSCPVNKASGNTDPAASGNSTCTKDNCNLITKYINPLITLLSAAVGLAVSISIIVGGIQYASSAGDPAKASAAKNRIRNSIIALITYLFLFALLQFLVPGGIFK